MSIAIRLHLTSDFKNCNDFFFGVSTEFFALAVKVPRALADTFRPLFVG